MALVQEKGNSESSIEEARTASAKKFLYSEIFPIVANVDSLDSERFTELVSQFKGENPGEGSDFGLDDVQKQAQVILSRDEKTAEDWGRLDEVVLIWRQVVDVLGKIEAEGAGVPV